MMITKLNYQVILLLFFLGSPAWLPAQKGKASFKVIPLGVKGGLDESNLSAYLMGDAVSGNYVCVDAGTLRYGIAKAISKGVFKSAPDRVLKTSIKGYLISHPHLDHVAGLILNAPDDTTKNIYALPFVINTLRDKYFTWQSWANFGDQGDKPTLNKYHYVNLAAGEDTAIANTGLRVKAFPLSHSGAGQSTAFLLSNKNNYLLYLGDTGPDAVEKSDMLATLWQQVVPLISSHELKAIFIEVSYANEQPDKLLFGHLTPHWLMEEMAALANLCGKAALQKVPVVITHIKPAANIEIEIKKQLAAANKLHLKLIYPVQGSVLKF